MRYRHRVNSVSLAVSAFKHGNLDGKVADSRTLRVAPNQFQAGSLCRQPVQKCVSTPPPTMNKRFSSLPVIAAMSMSYSMHLDTFLYYLSGTGTVACPKAAVTEPLARVD